MKTTLKELRSKLGLTKKEDYPEIDEVYIKVDGDYALIREGQWISGKKNFYRVDAVTHMQSGDQRHVHIYAKSKDKPGTELGVLNMDGSASHGTKMRLTKRMANELEKKCGVAVPENRIVEWVATDSLELSIAVQLLNE